ncbi:MAG: lipoyl(octanoyl) transferase LipB [Ignavibacteria bacterium]|nr:lipoyl(octanoyl) transferase LipB [Ignavibacteria bacterium]
MKIEIQDWGLIDYLEAWNRQKEIVKEVQTHRNRNIFIVCQHPSVITIGRASKPGHILLPTKFLEQKGVKVVETDRGGDVTLHNPGQLVGYFVFNLNAFRPDLHWFLREIENAIISLLDTFKLKGDRVDGMTGVWIEGQRKICSIGLRCSRWVTSHGFALNVCNDLSEFSYIVPCGIENKEVTSITKELGTEIDFDIVKQVCIEVFENRFAKGNNLEN